jgi:hypothetical protein
MKIRYGDIIRQNNVTSCNKSSVPEGRQLGENAKFQLKTHCGQTNIKVDL